MDGHFLIQLAVFLGVATFAALSRECSSSAQSWAISWRAPSSDLMARHNSSESLLNPETLRHTAELGVAMFLFLIGLQLRPKRLWKMRGAVFGVGSVQLAVTGLLLAGLIFWLARGRPFLPEGTLDRPCAGALVDGVRVANA